MSTEPEYCSQQIGGGGPGLASLDPAEYCENKAVEGSDYCQHHNPDAYWDYADQAYDEWRDRQMEQDDEH